MDNVNNLVLDTVLSVINSDKYSCLEDFITELEAEYYRHISPLNSALNDLDMLKKHYPEYTVRIETPDNMVTANIRDCTFYECRTADELQRSLVINIE